MFLARAIAASRRRFDLDASDYFARIVAAGSTISEPNKAAVNAFVTGCKADGIWTAIKASCLLAGPDDLTGALVPLVGPAPTNYNFLEGDYNRTTGLRGNASTKYLDSNRNNNADPQDDFHMSVYMSELPSDTTNRRSLIGCGVGDAGSSQVNTVSSLFEARLRTSANTNFGSLSASFAGLSRSSSASYVGRGSGANSTITQASQTPLSQNINVFRRGGGAPASTDARLSFYSIGESLDLALLDVRLATYMASIS
jgi:hypothetical protein